MPKMTEDEVRALAKTIGDVKTKVVAQSLLLILDEVQSINRKLAKEKARKKVKKK